jgi:very-short-patch-repair endonuclease
MPNGDRRYKESSIDDLEALAARIGQHRYVKQDILDELAHRNTARADRLRESIQRDLAEADARASQRSSGSDGDGHSTSLAPVDSPAQEPTATDVFPNSVSLDDTKVLDALNRIRTSLLDLSRRNKLLNYRWVKAEIRIVDSTLSDIWAMTENGRRIQFVPWESDLEGSHAPEDDVLDDDGLELEPGFPGPLFAADRDDSRVRGLPTGVPVEAGDSDQSNELRERRVTDADFDRPVSRDGDVRSPRPLLRTPYDEDDLEARLSKLFQESKLRLEETGANFLRLWLGALEYVEANYETESRSIAPLLLCPVTMGRSLDGRTGRWKYFLEPGEQEKGVNVTLQEMLRHEHGLELPSWEEDEPLASYFARVQALIAVKPGWRVCGYATVGLIGFEKILLYRDLDPKNWPDPMALVKHPRVRELLRVDGASIDYGSDWGSDQVYDLDGPTLPHPAPPLILDADSSQHSALVDILAGRNVVIQGPPGTGKSQTIANLIGAAINEGKSVLFVAEKRAALEVVHKRLRDRGLHHFALELHSNKSEKKAVLRDLAARLDLGRQLRDPRELHENRRRLEELRSELNGLCEVMQSVTGKLGWTNFELLWRNMACRRSLGSSVAALERLPWPTAPEFTASAWAGHVDRFQTLGRELERLRARYGRAQASPWFGFDVSPFPRIDLANLARAMTRLIAATDEVSDAATGLAALLGLDSPRSLGELKRVSRALELVPEPTSNVDGALGVLVRQDTRRDQVHAWLSLVDRVREDEARIQESWPRLVECPAPRAQALRAAVRELATMGQGPANLVEARAVIEMWRDKARQLRDAASLIRDLAHVIPAWSGPRTGNLRELCVLAPLLKELPTESLALRHEGLRETSAASALADAVPKVNRLRGAAERLSTAVRLELWTEDKEEAAVHLATIRDSRWWARLGKDYRSAAKAFARGSRKGRVPRVEMVAVLSDHVDLLSGRDSLRHNEPLKRAAGASFADERTPVVELQRQAAWWQAAFEASAVGGEGVKAVVEYLWNLETTMLRGLGSLWSQLDRAQELSTLLPWIESEVPAEAVGEDRGGPQLDDLAAVWEQRAASLAESAATLSEQGWDASRPLVDAQALLDSFIVLIGERDAAVAESRVLGIPESAWKGWADSAERVRETLSYDAALRDRKVDDGLSRWVLSGSPAERFATLRLARDRSATARTVVHRALRDVFPRSLTAVGRWVRSPGRHGLQFAALAERAAACQSADASEYALWADYCAQRSAATSGGGSALVGLAEADAVPASQLGVAFEFVASQQLVRMAFRTEGALERFRRMDHEKTREQFAALDQQVIQDSAVAIAAKLARVTAPAGVSIGSVQALTDLALISHEIGKQRRHIPIRQLMTRAGKAVRALKPVVMMSPLSVAQFIPPGSVQFDLVVMDEASQLKPQDALGAIARARQLVIVGDSQQLPPTTFFDVVDDGTGDGEYPEDDYAAAVMEAESILDVAAGVYRPATRTLRWHYRSRHESLIAFSNNRFYEDRLIVFPTPDRGEDVGVVFRPVPAAVYAKSLNLVEAREVVTAVTEHVARRPQDSIGVVALNRPQRDLIVSLLDAEVRSNALLREYVKTRDGQLEDLFVKNLENVQGDERDVIVISMTYGPATPGGTVAQRFGPINSQVGHRRLNVLFTRARRRVVVVSSMRAEQIRVEGSSSKGVQVLREYLEYAEQGRLPHLTFSGRDPESPFEIEVADCLRRWGYEVEAQLGVAGYFLDIAVRHPSSPGRFVLGIECDGATYHSSRVARDRDRLRESVLKDLGWKLHRIWSTEWFHHRGDEEVRLEHVLRSCLAP